MDNAYTFDAKNRNKEMMSGIVYASDPESAYIKLKMLGYQPSGQPQLNLSATLQSMMGSGFNRKELARFYTSMAKRLKNGRSVPEGLDNAVEFVDDPKLKQALIMMKQFVLEGNSLAGAMKLSGFPMRDVEVIRSTSEAGKTPETMDRIAKEMVRADALRSSIMSVLRMPMVICFIMYVAVYMMIVFIAPAMSKFFKTALTSVKLPAFAQGFYDFSAMFKANIYIGTILYVCLLAGVIWFIRSPIFQELIDRVKLVHRISERSDQANLWTSFSMLYDAGINTEVSTKMLADAAVRPASRESFLTMHRLLRSGSKIVDAVAKSGFPIYIVRGVQAADSGGELVAGLDDMCKDLAQDIEEYTSKLKDFISLASVAVLSLFVLIFFMLSYYPILSSTLSQV
jgi:type II secretory pathway component PulF